VLLQQPTTTKSAFISDEKKLTVVNYCIGEQSTGALTGIADVRITTSVRVT
jgi:hypothetical protein